MYNNFGLTYVDIVDLFSGQVSDFDSPGKSNGKENIEREIEIQMGKLLSQIPASALRIFEYIEDVKIDNFSVSGGTTTFTFPSSLPPVLTGTFTAYKIYSGTTGKCAEDNCTNLSIASYGTEVTVTSPTTGAATCAYQATIADDLTDYDLYVSYEVDSDNACFEITELAGCLRDMVACVLGSKLLIEADKEWRLLDIVCATKFQPAKNWIPMEYRRLKWWSNPWISGPITGKLGRG